MYDPANDAGGCGRCGQRGSHLDNCDWQAHQQADPAVAIQALGEETAAICKEIPSLLNIRTILNEVYARLIAIPGVSALPQQAILEKVVDVLREIATHAVEEYTNRSGQPFLWVDAPEEQVEEHTFMTFAFDEKGQIKVL